MKKLLPQANTLATVIRTFKLIGNTMNCTLTDIASFNNFELRQASYYSNACYFLDLIDENLKLTPLGEDIMQDPKKAKVRIYEQILKNELIGQLFAKTALYPKRTAVKEGKEIVRALYPDYGEAVIDRRTKCLIGWCEEIIDYIRTQKNI
jgi:hypothetical protein